MFKMCTIILYNFLQIPFNAARNFKDINLI